MRLGIMCSGSGTNFENIVRTCRDDEVVMMIHNKKECGAKKRAIKFGIPHVNIKSANEDEIIQLFQAWRVDLIVLAGWMRIVSSKLIDAFPNRIINIHPSLLPKYKGLNAVQQALDSDDLVTGCTVHYVTEELDSGAIICQAEVAIGHRDTLETLTKRIQREEHRILPLAIENVKHKLQIKTY
jgi:formyltetrahydrofolate-dependent phosphoribosylglycinamide formyltransferase